MDRFSKNVAGVKSQALLQEVTMDQLVHTKYECKLICRAKLRIYWKAVSIMFGVIIDLLSDRYNSRRIKVLQIHKCCSDMSHIDRLLYGRNLV